MARGPSHQTVILERGRHTAPSEGACVMELASMLAGERFSDRPRCVDPVLAAFMRDLNDVLGEVSRQRLKPYAPLAVGTAGDRATRRARRDRCLAFAAGTRRAPRAARLRVLLGVGVLAAVRLDRGAPQWAVRALLRRGVEPHAFALLEALIAAGPAAGEPAWDPTLPLAAPTDPATAGTGAAPPLVPA